VAALNFIKSRAMSSLRRAPNPLVIGSSMIADSLALVSVEVDVRES
jgi:hypothetical protein